MISAEERREQAIKFGLMKANAAGFAAVNFNTVAALCECDRKQLQRVFGPQPDFIAAVELRALDNRSRYPRAYVEAWARRAGVSQLRKVGKFIAETNE